MRGFLREWWLEIALTAVVAFAISLIAADHFAFTEACRQKGGTVWQREGRACLLPPYNRVEL